ncbi:AAA family ATPase, partial [Candidatus Kaiserbacteria bacterium]|nr:AAA family ATPase [Candidatus Kaiserbacteria bacterium]
AVKRGITATEVLAASTLATFERSKLYRPEKCRQIENYAIPKAVQAALVKPVAKANLVTAEPLLSLAAGRLVLPKSPPPKRAWTIDKLLPSGKCGVLAGLGGVSKTMVASVWGVHVAIGKTWADLDVAEGAAMLLLGEEDQAEVYARVGAICRELSDKERTTVEDRLLVFPWAGKDLRLTRLCEGNPIETTLVSEIIRAAQAHAARCGKLIRLIVIDHARLAIGGDPNDAQHVSEVMRASTKIADVTGAAVLLIAHSPKTAIAKLKNGDDADAADVAGSIAWVDNSRSAMVLTTMREDEAKKFGIDKDLRHQYARLKLVKANYAPTDWGCWLHRHTVPGWGVAVPVVATLAPPPKTSSNRDLEVRVLTLVSELPGQLSLRKLRNNYAGKTKHLKASEGEVELALQKLLKENRLQQRAPNEEEKREYGLARTPLVLEAAE